MITIHKAMNRLNNLETQSTNTLRNILKDLGFNHSNSDQIIEILLDAYDDIKFLIKQFWVEEKEETNTNNQDETKIFYKRVRPPDFVKRKELNKTIRII